MSDDLIRRTFERAAQLAERADRDPGDAYAERWSRIMQSLGDSAAADYRHPLDIEPRER